MLTKNTIAHIRSLHDKRSRHEQGLFLVEGHKGIMEFLASDFEIVEMYVTEKYLSQHESEIRSARCTPTLVSESELARITTLTTNESGLLVLRMRTPSSQGDSVSRGLTLVLDGINDPGNLGTIIRIADWYSISHIIASQDTVDCYNPKVIMATMGSFTRLQITYEDLPTTLSSLDPETPVYGAYLDGENIHDKKFAGARGYLVIGSESHGISAALESYITDRITIPRYGQAESLNAGVATGIILDRMIGG